MNRFLFKLSLSLFSTLLCSFGTKAQYNPTLPDARARAHLIYHPTLEALLLFDGYYASHFDSTQNNVWKWDGQQWKQIVTFGPGSRILNSAALNMGNGLVTLFAGWGKGKLNDKRSDVWTFDGKNWSELQTNNTATRDHHKMTYMDHLSAFLVYGGFSADFKPDTTTLLLKGDKFMTLKIKGPGARGNTAMAYDPMRKRAVLFGGNFPSRSKGDLWEFDGEKWEEILVDDIGVATGHAMTFSEVHGMVVIHGLNGTTWGWNGKRMERLATGGPLESGIALAYDPVRKVIAAFGGFGANRTASSSLWELQNEQWKKISDNGTWRQVSMDSYERIADDVATAFHHAHALVSAKEIAKAETYLLKSIDKGTRSSILYTLLSELQYKLRKYQEGVESLERALVLDPQGIEFYNLARGYALLGNKEKALEGLENAYKNGYGHRQQLTGDPAFESIRDDEKFKAFLLKLK
jgi:tetratricopeptide (TPR) repeat protein